VNMERKKDMISTYKLPNKALHIHVSIVVVVRIISLHISTLPRFHPFTHQHRIDILSISTSTFLF
jgi:hypothetical protein